MSPMHTNAPLLNLILPSVSLIDKTHDEIVSYCTLVSLYCLGKRAGAQVGDTHTRKQGDAEYLEQSVGRTRCW